MRGLAINHGLVGVSCSELCGLQVHATLKWKRQTPKLAITALAKQVVQGTIGDQFMRGMLGLCGKLPCWGKGCVRRG